MAATLLMVALQSSGQAVGDYRTNSTGAWNWNTAANWQRCVTAGTWAGATSTTYPGQVAGAGTVNILNNTVVTITADVPNSIGSLRIDGGNRESYVIFDPGTSLTVTGETYLLSSINNRHKAVQVLAGSFRTGSVSANSSNNNRDAYISISTGSVVVDGNITMSGTGLQSFMLFTGTGTLQIGGTMTGGGITSASGGGTSAPTSGTVIYTGTASQAIGAYTYYNLSLDNGAGFSLSGDVTINNSLSMVDADITSGTNKITLTNSIPGSLVYTSGKITGIFQRAVGTTAAEYLFPVGTSLNYNPLKTSFSNLTAGQLAVQFIPNDIGGAGLPLFNDSGSDIYSAHPAGYWTLTAVAPMASANYDVNLNYSGFPEVDANARILKRTAGGNLVADGLHGTVSSPEITRSALNGISTVTTDLAIGRPHPRFTSHPSDFSGCTAQFSVTVSGRAPLSYQWQEDSGTGFTDISDGGIYSGSTTATLSVTGATVPMSGWQYRCIVTDGAGYSAVSNPATLTVSLPQVSLGYLYSMDVTLSQASGTEDLTDFPALISLTLPELLSEANLGHVSNANGYDVIFNDINGSRLDHQLESYDPLTGNYVAWVRIPVLSSTTTTTIRMLYGNSSITADQSVNSVWTSSYKGVWHLNGTNYTDGTSNGNDGTESNTTNVTGKIAGARGFNGTTSYISVPANGFVANDNNQTISIWANYPAIPADSRNLISFQHDAVGSAIQLGFRGGNAVAWKWGGVILANGGAAPSANAWHYYVYTFDGTTSRIYIDGVLAGSSSVAPQTLVPTQGNIGRYNNGEYLQASLDEPRFSMSSKNAGWIQTEYNNQNDPAAFITTGSETASTVLASVGVCATTYLLDQGFPAGGIYSGPGVSGTNFDASVAGVGTHTILYTYTDPVGCTAIASKEIIVTPAPVAPVGVSKECCETNITDLEATGTNLKWYSDAGLTTLVGTGTPFATGQTAAGVYTYYVTQSLNGCESPAAMAILTVYDAITVNVQPVAATICDGDDALFTLSVSGYNLTYQWQVNGVDIVDGGIYSGAATDSLIILNPGLAGSGITYRCIITSSCGGIPVTSDEVILTVTPIPVAAFSYAGSPYCPDAANPLPTFIGGGVAGTFSSTAGLVFVSTATGEIDIAASTPGIYTVTNTIAATGGCGIVESSNSVEIIAYRIWTGTADSDWNNPSNWTCGLLPDITTPVQIPDVPNKPVLSAGATGSAYDLTIDAGSSLVINGNILQIAGTITNSGDFTASSGTIELNGTAAQYIGASTFTANTIGNLTINNNAGVTLLGALNISGIVTLQTGELISGGNLTLLSDPSGTALISGSGTGTVTGNVTMQRYLPAGFGYKYFSSPFAAATVAEFNDEPINLLYRYDENRLVGGSPASGWVNYNGAINILNPMAGYAVNFGNHSDPKTVDITGTVNSGPLSLTVYNNDQLYTRGFNLVGNPYPSPIDWDLIKGGNVNVDDAIYYFKASTTDQYGGTYRSYVNGISSDGVATNVIPSMQGFFIHVSDGAYPVTGTINMDNSVRITDQTHTFMKSGGRKSGSILRVAAAYSDDVSAADPLVIYYDEKAGADYDSRLDGLKLYNTDISVPNFYAISSDGKRLSINGLPLPDELNDTIPLGIRTYKDAGVTFMLQQKEGQFTGQDVFIHDEATGVSNLIAAGAEYSLFLTSGDYTGRFSVIISDMATKIPDTPAPGFFAYYSGGMLVAELSVMEAESGTLTVHNLQGQLLFTRKVYETGRHEFAGISGNGIYVVSFVTGKTRLAQKVFIYSR